MAKGRRRDSKKNFLMVKKVSVPSLGEPKRGVKTIDG